MKHPALVTLTALSTCACLGGAELFSYATSVMTECPTDDAYQTDAAVTTPAAHGTYAYNMPTCDCGCPTCTFTSVYTTSYPILCPTGVADQLYTITETYVGLSSLPTWPEPTTTPYGFTTTDATCTVCGEAPVTTVITYPSSGLTYYDGTQPTAVPAVYPSQGAGPINSVAPYVTPDSHGATYTGASSPANAGYGNSANTATITKSLAQGKQTSVSAGSHPTYVPVQVSRAPAGSELLTPLLCVVGFVSALLALS